MAALAPVANVCSVKLRWTVGVDTTCFNTFHVRYQGSGPDNTQALSLATSIDATVGASFTISQHPSTVLTQVTVTDLASPTGGQGVFAANRPGTAGGGILPANACVLAHATIQRRYRGGKPRSYIPMGTDTDLVTAQSFGATQVTNFQTRMNTFTSQVSALTWATGNFTGFVSVSYYLGGTWVDKSGTGKGPFKRVPTPRAAPLVDPITAWTIEATLASQRRRVRGKK